MKIENIATSAIIPYSGNAKEHPEWHIKQIVESIQQFGFNDPIAIDKANRVIEGHGRLAACKELGYTEIPCIRLADLTEEQERAYIIAHNKLTMNTGFNSEKILEELMALQLQDFDLSLTGFTAEEIEDLQDAQLEKLEEDDVPELEETPYAKLGDIWHLGRHTLICGDSTKRDAAARIPEIDCVITDPPYNVDYTEKAKLTHANTKGIQNDKMTEAAFDKFLAAFLTIAYARLKKGGAIYIFYPSSQVRPFTGAVLDAGFKISEQLVWVKDSFVFGRSDYYYKHEPIIYGGKEDPECWNYEPIVYGWKEGKAHYFNKDYNCSTVIECARPKRSTEHPTMKPLDLLKVLIRNSTRRREIIYDPFLGSGSTLIAAEQTERTCTGYELDPRYVDVIVKRYANLDKTDITLERAGKVQKWPDISDKYLTKEPKHATIETK